MISRLKQNIIKITKIYYAGGLAASERPMMRQKWARWSCQFRSSRARCASIQTRSFKRTSMHILAFQFGWYSGNGSKWVSHRYGLFRRRLEKKEKEQREELRRKAMEWNAGLRAACVPWTPNEVFRSRDFASRVHDLARELEEFDEEEKAGEPPGYRRSMQIYPRAPAEVRRSLEERERKGTDGAWAPRKRLAKAQAAGSFEEAAMCEVRDGFLLNPPDQFRWDFTDLVARYARMKHAISRILAAYDEGDRRRQMACGVSFVD